MNVYAQFVARALCRSEMLRNLWYLLVCSNFQKGGYDANIGNRKSDHL